MSIQNNSLGADMNSPYFRDMWLTDSRRRTLNHRRHSSRNSFPVRRWPPTMSNDERIVALLDRHVLHPCIDVSCLLHERCGADLSTISVHRDVTNMPGSRSSRFDFFNLSTRN